MKRYITFLLFAAILFTFLPWLGDTLFNTKGEPREAIVALSMINSGDYILPSSCGGDIPYKPPFLAWLIVACSWLTGGVTEVSARMPSALATIAMAAGFYLFLRRRIADTKRAHFIAVLSTAVTVTAFEVYRAATACRVDMVLTACVVGAILLFNRRREKDGVPNVSIFGILLMACAVLTKGPIGMILPCLVLGIYFLLRGDNFWRTFGVLSFSGLISLAGYCLWLYFAYKQGGQKFFDLVWEENIGRMTGTMSYESHVNPAYYNLITIIAGMVPYTLAALMGIVLIKWRRFSLRGIWSRLKGLEPVSLLSLTVIVVTLVFYSIPASKRSVYLLPLYPFLSYYTALMLIEITNRSRRIIAIYSGILATLAIIASLVTVIVNAAPVKDLVSGLKPDIANYILALHSWEISFAGWLCIAMACVAGFYTWTAIRRKGNFSVLGWGIVSTFALYWVMSSTIQPAVLSSKSDLRFAKVIERYVDDDQPVYSYISDGLLRFYTAGFYLNDRLVPIQGRSPRMGYIMVNENNLEEFLLKYGEKYRLSLVYESTRKSCDTRSRVKIFHFSSDFR